MSRSWMIDFDGVIASLDDAMVRSCNAKFDTDYTVDDIDNWHWWRDQGQDIADYVWKECYPDTRWLLEEVHPYEGAIDALADLVTDGDIAESAAIISARPNEHKERIEQWIAQQGVPAITKIPIFCVGRKSKATFCQLLGLDTVVEDGVHNLQQMNAYRQTLFLVDRPWNRNELITKVTHISGLQGAIDHVAKEVVAA